MIAAFSRAIAAMVVAQPVHVIEVDVGHDRHAAVPGVGGVEPATQADLDEREVRADLREAGEDDGRQQLELGRFAMAPGDAHRRDAQDPLDEPREVVGGDRPPIDLDPLAVGHEMRLGRRPDAVARRRAARESARARTLPLPFVPAISAPRTGAPDGRASRSRARVRPRPSRIPKRPRSARARSASW